jgi:queuine tRNA-ribosyltransferase
VNPKYFKTENGKLKLPVFFPDATRAIVRTIDSKDIEETFTPGILVNTYHLYKDLGKNVLKKHNGIRGFMSFRGGVISDSGGFQVMSIAKAKKSGSVTDIGVTFQEGNKKILLTPEKSIEFQMVLGSDMVVVLDDFTKPNANYEEAEETVKRTILWAERSKQEFEKICKTQKLDKNNRPYILGVVQGGSFPDLREKCTKELVKIGFDGLGYGGWPITPDKVFDYETARIIAENTPSGYFLYGLGIGKPDEIVGCVDLGYHIFDCVLPTRDARHKRLYVYEAKSIKDIDVRQPKFYSYYVPDKEKHYNEEIPVSTACDCLLCRRYTRAYLAHLFRIKELSAMRLATIHNLRFYSILMEKLQNQ